MSFVWCDCRLPLGGCCPRCWPLELVEDYQDVIVNCKNVPDNCQSSTGSNNIRVFKSGHLIQVWQHNTSVNQGHTASWLCAKTTVYKRALHRFSIALLRHCQMSSSLKEDLNQHSTTRNMISFYTAHSSFLSKPGAFINSNTSRVSGQISHNSLKDAIWA